MRKHEIINDKYEKKKKKKKPCMRNQKNLLSDEQDQQSVHSVTYTNNFPFRSNVVQLFKLRAQQDT